MSCSFWIVVWIVGLCVSCRQLASYLRNILSSLFWTGGGGVTQLRSKVEQVSWNIFCDFYQCLQVSAGLTVYIGYGCFF
jgi:hypothetical protein